MGHFGLSACRPAHLPLPTMSVLLAEPASSRSVSTAWADNPYNRPDAIRASSYHAPGVRGLVNLSHEDAPGDQVLHAVAVDGAFRAFVTAPDFPCVGAKSAVNGGSYRLGLYGGLGSAQATAGLCRDLYRFSREFEQIDKRFATFAAVFDQPLQSDETVFEQRLWRQLQALHLEDAPLHGWDERVDSDPDSSDFSFSFGGVAFFIVGLHPNSSRFSRKFPWPTLVFNLHEQFEALRQEGKMERMKTVIRTRDEQLQGKVNPVLDDHGKSSEARQYSGRAVEPDWSPPFVAVEPRETQCPFHRLFGGRTAEARQVRATRRREGARGREV
jgi:FPC/CPF motif-containing protein YcgG